MPQKTLTTAAKLDRLTTIVESLAASVVAHDNQIEGLILVAERNQKQIDKTTRQIANLEKQWQAYLSTLPRQ